jgi:hypothetical protein
MYWDDYSASPVSISFASLDGSGGGSLNVAGAELESPEGLAYDTVTNRLYVPNEGVSGTGQITWINLDGSGTGRLVAPGALIDEPEGVAIDPSTRTIYWLNTDAEPESISWALLDGSGGGALNVAGATLEGAYRLAIDPVGGRLYWGNNVGGTASVSFTNLNGNGGGNLNLGGATPPKSISGLAVDPAAGRIYWLNSEIQGVSFASLNGLGGGDIHLAGATILDPYGLALDPTLGEFYWGNYGNKEVRANAIGTGLLSGIGGGITPQIAPVNGPQDPLIVKPPAGTAAPLVTKAAHSAALTCSAGSWGADFVGSNVYRAPRSYGYQWTLNGAAIAGATGTGYTATAPGAYACTVTATNQAGSTAQASVAVPVVTGGLRLRLKTRKAHAKAGKADIVKIALSNGGDLASARGKVCAKLTKKAKKGLKAPKCKPVSAIAPGASSIVSLTIHTRTTAHGVYKFQVTVPSAAKPLSAQVKVTAAKKHRPKHHKH